MTELLFRLAVYVPVLFLIAVVVTGQHHVTARETVKDAARRSMRWLLYTGILYAFVLAYTWLLID